VITAGYTFFGLVDVAIFNYPRWSDTLWPVIVMFGIVGLPVGFHVPAIWMLFQLETPDRLRGRAFAAIWSGFALAGMLGAGIAGALGQTVSVVDLLTVQGAGIVVAAVLFRILAGTGPAPLHAGQAPTVPSPAAPPPLERDAAALR
jgi:hypothetical protein